MACSRETDGNPAEEVVQGMTVREHVEQRAHRHARSRKARRATHDLGIDKDRIHHMSGRRALRHERRLTLCPSE